MNLPPTPIPTSKPSSSGGGSSAKIRYFFCKQDIRQRKYEYIKEKCRIG